ncbi:MAG: Spy/CpxP family protein refolding chaperone [Longimicrobiales bacterium]
MKWTMGGAALLAALVALAPAQVDAQVGPRGQRAMGPALRGGGVEMILNQKERLELTDDQVKQLDQIRQEAVQRRTEHQAQMAELRSKVRSGQEKPEALREQVEARRQVAAAMQEAQRARVEGILNDAQKEEMQDWAQQGRAFRMGQQSALRGGAGFGPGAGRNPGMRGGFGQGMQRMHQQWGPGAAGPMGGRAMMRRGHGGGWGFGAPADSIPPK